MHTQRDDHIETREEGKDRGLRRPHPVDTSIWDFWPPGLWEDKPGLLEPHLWYLLWLPKQRKAVMPQPACQHVSKDVQARCR
jgi:hypothetical protein